MVSKRKLRFLRIALVICLVVILIVLGLYHFQFPKIRRVTHKDRQVGIALFAGFMSYLEVDEVQRRLSYLQMPYTVIDMSPPPRLVKKGASPNRTLHVCIEECQIAGVEGDLVLEFFNDRLTYVSFSFDKYAYGPAYLEYYRDLQRRAIPPLVIDALNFASGIQPVSSEERLATVVFRDNRLWHEQIQWIMKYAE